MKKFLAIALSLMMVLALVACTASTTTTTTETKTDTAATETKTEQQAQPEAKAFKVGAVLVGDENEGYTYAHMEGIQLAVKALGLGEDCIVWKYKVPEDEKCTDACEDCIDQGCKLIITNSYGHQTYAQEVAANHPDVQVIAMTGDTAKASGLSNFHNAFTKIYEARYVAGVVAGMKLQQLIDEGKITDKNIDEDGNYKIGYVGAFPYAEVVSGYTAFFLGIRSIVKNVHMDVQFTNSWFDQVAESECATALMERGCVIIGQHADSTGAPATCEAALNNGTVVYSVGYNIDMLQAAPHAALTSPTNEWAVYYTYAIGKAMNGEAFDTNFAAGFDQDGVKITTLGPECAPGTQEKVDETIAAIKAGTLHVFDTSTFTVDGQEVTSAFATDTNGDWINDADEAVFDGYFHESYFQSAPAFALAIDGITKLN